MYNVNVTESGYVNKHFDGVFQTKSQPESRAECFLILHHLKLGKMEFDQEEVVSDGVDIEVEDLGYLLEEGNLKEVRDQRVLDELDDTVCKIFASDSDEEFE